MVSQRFSSITPSSTISLNNLYNKMKKEGQDVISFAAGEPDPTTPMDVIEFAFEKAKNGGTHYTPSGGIPELRNEISIKYSKMTGSEIKAEDVIITPAKFALNMAIESVVEPGDEVLIQDPSFVSYHEMIKIAGGFPVYFPSNDDGSPNISKLQELINRKTKMIIINSPENPNGWVATKEELKAISDLSIDHDFYVLSDEIYETIIYEGQHISILKFPGMAERTFVVNGFSKSHAMTGWRIGYLISPHALSGYIDAYQQHTITCASSVSQYAALKAIKNEDFPKHMNLMFKERRDILFESLSKIEDLKITKPKGTFYMFPKILNGMTGDELSNRLLKEKKILVTPGSQFGPSGINSIRLSFSLYKEDLIRGAERIIDFFDSL